MTTHANLVQLVEMTDADLVATICADPAVARDIVADLMRMRDESDSSTRALERVVVSHLDAKAAELAPPSPEEVDLLEHGDEIADQIASAIAEGDQPTDIERLAQAHVLLGDRFDDFLRATQLVPKQARCLWCWRAQGGTQAAWDELPPMPIDDVFEHVRACAHNTLAQQLTRMDHLLDTARRLRGDNERELSVLEAVDALGGVRCG